MIVRAITNHLHPTNVGLPTFITLPPIAIMYSNCVKTPQPHRVVTNLIANIKPNIHLKVKFFLTATAKQSTEGWLRRLSTDYYGSSWNKRCADFLQDFLLDLALFMGPGVTSSLLREVARYVARADLFRSVLNHAVEILGFSHCTPDKMPDLSLLLQRWSIDA